MLSPMPSEAATPRVSWLRFELAQMPARLPPSRHHQVLSRLLSPTPNRKALSMTTGRNFVYISLASNAAPSLQEGRKLFRFPYRLANVLLSRLLIFHSSARIVEIKMGNSLLFWSEGNEEQGLDGAMLRDMRFRSYWGPGVDLSVLARTDMASLRVLFELEREGESAGVSFPPPWPYVNVVCADCNTKSRSGYIMVRDERLAL